MWTAVVISAALGQVPPAAAARAMAPPGIAMPSPESQAQLRELNARRRLRFRRGQMRYQQAAAMAPIVLAQTQANMDYMQARANYMMANPFGTPGGSSSSGGGHKERDQAGQGDRQRK